MGTKSHALQAPIDTDREPTRQSNFELLRIFSMLLIVAHHLAVHSLFAEPTAQTPVLNQIWILLLSYGGKVGVNLFVMITGYFLVGSKQLKVSKVFKLWLQIFTYSAAVAATYTLISRKFDLHLLRTVFAPVCASDWWFVRVYFALFILSPFLNRLLQQLNKHSYQIMLLLMAAMFCLLPSLTRLLFQTEFSVGNLSWFVFLYCFSSYLRLWGQNIHVSPYCFLLGAFGIFCLTVLAFYAYCRIRHIPPALSPFLIYINQNRILVFIVSCLFFMGTRQLPIRHSKWINTVASTTFGIYLLHDHKTVRYLLWERLLRMERWQNSIYLIPLSLAVIAAVFIGCGIVEWLRIHTVEKWYMRPVERISFKLQNKLYPANNRI